MLRVIIQEKQLPKYFVKYVNNTSLLRRNGELL